MNGVVLVTCAIVILAVAYRFYGKWLAKTWGIDPNALTPAHRLEDGQDYTASDVDASAAHGFLACGKRIRKEIGEHRPVHDGRHRKMLFRPAHRFVQRGYAV